MKKFCLFITLFSLLCMFPLNKVFALTLDKIGVLETDGHTYPEWWYTGNTPTLYGTAENGATVTIAVDGQSSSATADSSGNWSFYLGSVVSGDHSISITSGGDSYAFTLHLGQDLPSDLGTSVSTSESTISVPNTGSQQFIMGVGAAILIVSGWYLWDRRKTLRAFEDSVTRDLS